MVRTNIKLLGAALMTGLLLLLPANTAFAAGTVTVAADKEAAAVGDTCIVAYKTDGAGDGAEAPEISVEYDENRLSLLESDKTYGGGGGKLTFTDSEATMTFTILSGGPAEVYVTAVLDGDGANPATGSVTVNVEGEDTAAAATATTSANSVSTGVEAGTVMSLDGTKTISTVFPDEMMPELFHKTTAAYSGTTIEAAQFDMGNILLVYVTDEATNTGGFCVIDQNTGELTDFRMIRGIENKFIIILKAPSSAEVPLNFTKATLMWNDQTLEAYMIADASGDSSDEAQPAYSSGNVSAQDFFLVYAMSSEGNEGWYLYDQKEGTYQRYLQVIRTAVGDDGNQMPITEAATEAAASKYEKPMRLRLIIICALGAISLILLIIVIVLAVKSGRDDEDEEDDDDYDMPAEPVQTRVRAQQRHRIAVAEEDDEDDEDEEDDEDDEEDYDEDDEDEEDDVEDDEDDEDDDEEEDDEEDNEEDDVKEYVKPVPEKRGIIEDDTQAESDSSEVLNPRSRKERGRGKNTPIAQTQAIDWSEMESVMKGASADSRRPVGNNTAALPSRYRIDSELSKKNEKVVTKEAGPDVPVISSKNGKAISQEEAASVKKTAAAAAVRTGNTGAMAIAEAAAASASGGRKGDAPYYEEQAAPTMREEIQAEKRGKNPSGRRRGYEPEEMDEEDEDDDEDEGFSFFRRNKKKVPKKVEKRSRKGNRAADDENGMNYDREQDYEPRQRGGRRDRNAANRQDYRGRQGYGQGGYDQGYQQYPQGQYPQGQQGYMNQGYG